MALLALDASTEACAVGIQTDEGELFEAFEIAPRRHTELLPKMLDSVLVDSNINKKDIKGCIVGVGPGAFTGIRIGVATIQGIALGLNVPCYAVSSLQAIAQQSLLNSPCTSSILACIDARMDEIYFAEYAVTSSQMTQLVGAESLIANDQFVLPDGCLRVVGSGVDCIKQHLDISIELQADCYPSAKSLFDVFNKTTLTPLSAELLTPSYIRNQVTYQNKKSK